MMSTRPAYDQELVLLGGGHAHALALRMLAMKPPGKARITLVSMGEETPYSGMLPGLIAGHYEKSQAFLDLRRYCARLGVRFIRAEALGLDVAKQCLFLRDRAPLDFDLLSIDIGSQPGTSSVPGATEHAVTVKPIASFQERWEQVLTRVGAQANEALKLAVVGGGAGSVELILAMAHHFREASVSLSLVCGSELLAGYSRATRRAAYRYCQRAGIEVLEQQPVTAVTGGQLRFDGEGARNFDEVFWCTQAAAPAWLKDTGLALDDSGFIRVRDTLQSIGYGNIFAAGDIASQDSNPSPKAGVYAVRQAPTLASNLRAACLSETLRPFRPQKRFLSLLSMGDQYALAERGPFRVRGRWVWRWKNHIDRKFMESFDQLLPAMPIEPGPAMEMHCGGCGAKLPGVALRRVLQRISSSYPAAVQAEALADDAVELEVPNPGKLFQTVDVLRQFIDDPWLTGRITALHAFSDIHAMGGKVESMLAQVALPYASQHLQESDLYQLLAGACHELAIEGAHLSGGHTLEAPELMLGFTVNGRCERKPLRKQGAVAGDALVLTKALGSGILLAAHQQALCRGEWINEAINNMLLSNRKAADLAKDFRVHAMTDVTGFGLLGHLLEMIEGQNLRVNLQSRQVPLLPGVEELNQQGIKSTLLPGNLELVSKTLPKSSQEFSRDHYPFLDPQTSGGLLIAVHPDDAAQLISRLHQDAYAHAAEIGRLLDISGDAEITISD